MNRAVIIGNLTKDPEKKATNSGVSVCTFTVAVSRRGQEQTDFIPVVAWKGTADNCGKYLAKGKQVAVCGRIQTRSYEDKQGVKRYVTELIAEEVQFLGKKEDAAWEPDESGFPF